MQYTLHRLSTRWVIGIGSGRKSRRMGKCGELISEAAYFSASQAAKCSESTITVHNLLKILVGCLGPLCSRALWLGRLSLFDTSTGWLVRLLSDEMRGHVSRARRSSYTSQHEVVVYLVELGKLSELGLVMPTKRVAICLIRHVPMIWVHPRLI